MAQLPRIAITLGEPAGIGPDLFIQLSQQGLLADCVVIADPELLHERAAQLRLPFSSAAHTIIPVKLAVPCQSGQLNVANAAYVLHTLTLAAEGCLRGEFAALVTGPVHKGILNQAGITFLGHTEFFAKLANVSQVVMMLMAEQLRVALVTTHMPLSAVSAAITPTLLSNALQILQQELRRYFAIAQPKILVCGLNPHAGENGYLGREEIDIIIPVLQQLRQTGMDLIGPLPADTAFLPKNLAGIDAVLTMYHDQGLPVLKHIGFDHAVNITLGLPFIRTSVDHGTALELAGTGQADSRSFLAALNTAIALARNNQRSSPHSISNTP